MLTYQVQLASHLLTYPPQSPPFHSSKLPPICRTIPSFSTANLLFLALHNIIILLMTPLGEFQAPSISSFITLASQFIRHQAMILLFSLSGQIGRQVGRQVGREGGRQVGMLRIGQSRYNYGLSSPFNGLITYLAILDDGNDDDDAVDRFFFFC